MENFANYEQLLHWLTQHGSVVLFALLAFGIIAAPIPDESLMVLAGVLMRKGTLSIPPTLLAVYGGSLCGVSVSYLIGRTAGYYLIHKYGGWVGFTEEKIKKVEDWFSHYGKWTLFFGYFVPGIRHFSGLSAGATHLCFRDFAIFAYSGGFIWASTFVSVGFFLGDYLTDLGYFIGDAWIDIYETIEIDINWIMILLLASLAIYALYQIFKEKHKKQP